MSAVGLGGRGSARWRLDLLLAEVDRAAAGDAPHASADEVTRPPAEAARFRALYDATYRRVLAYARRRTAQQADADDAVAETFLVAWRRLEKVPGDDDEAMAWLYGVARRVLANQHRGRRRRSTLQRGLAGQRPRAAPDPADVAADDVERVLRALDELSAAHREVLRLAAWEGLPHAQIATALGISERTVATRLHRARRRLAAVLAEPTG